MSPSLLDPAGAGELDGAEHAHGLDRKGSRGPDGFDEAGLAVVRLDGRWLSVLVLVAVTATIVALAYTTSLGNAVHELAEHLRSVSIGTRWER